MKRTAILLTVILSAAGCGETDPVVEKSADSATGHSQTNAHELNTADSADEFARALVVLTKQAQQFESNLQFAEAAGVWKEIDAALSKKFGSESWQTANARLSAIVAEMQTSFTPQQKQKSRQAQEFQRRLTESVSQADRTSAIEYATSSLNLTRELFGENSPLIGKQLLQLGTLNKQLGNYDVAIKSFHQASNQLKATFHSNHPDIEKAHHELGLLYLAKKSFVPAITNLKVSAKLAAQLWGEDSLLYARAANQLGVAYQMAGQSATAFKIHQAAELIRSRKLGPNHALVAHSQLNLGIVCIDMKNYKLAGKYLSQAIAGFKAQDQIESQLLSRAQEKLAIVHMLGGQLEQAELLLEAVLQRQVSIHGNHSAAVAQLKYQLGIALAKQGKYGRAEPLLRQALSTQQATIGDGEKNTIQTMRAIALLLQQTGRENESRQLNREIEQSARQSDSNEFVR